MSGAHKLPMDPLMNIKTKIIVYVIHTIYIVVYRNYYGVYGGSRVQFWIITNDS